MQCTPVICHVIRAIVRKEVCRAVWSLPWPHNTLHEKENDHGCPGGMSTFERFSGHFFLKVFFE